MKITAQLKLAMQVNSFIGIVAAMCLILSNVSLPLAWAGLSINIYSLLFWIFVKEDGNGETK